MASVTRENIGLLNDKITVKIEKEDYLPSFEKALKEYSKKANIPGFRKGMVPAGLIKKMYGHSVFTDEVLRTVEKELTTYMQQEKLEIFAQPLPLPENDARQIDMAQPAGYAFAFEVGLKPVFQLADLPNAKLTSYKVDVTPALIDEELDRQRNRHGKMTEPETVTTEENVLNLNFIESDDQGQEFEGGIKKDNSLLVKYFKEDFRNNWMGKIKEDFLVFQLPLAFDEKEKDWVVSDLGLSKDEPENLNKYFKAVIIKIGLLEKAELNEEFFNAVYPGKEIKNEEAFRDAIRADIQAYWDAQTRSQLQHAIYHELLDQTRIEFPESFLKRWLQKGGESETSKSEEQVQREFGDFSQQLKWTLITDKVASEQKIEVQPEDLKAMAKQQLIQYMQGQISNDQLPWIEDYANRMLKDRKFVEDAAHRVQVNKLFEWAETQVHPEEKSINREDFMKMQVEHQHHHH
jgi:trigger factor